MYKMPFADFDPARFMADFKIPAFDAEGAMALHRKNVEAMTAAGQTAFEGAGAVVRRQGELAREAVEASAANMNMFFGDASFEDKAERSAALVKGAWESAVAGAGELAEMSTRTGRDVFGMLDKRVRDAMDETAAMVVPAAKPAEKAVPAKS
ncbi:MAG: phasin family protein [Alphaproteobacteria bacterium]|nr:phasin family protein [Alphaproteobacteria bacterium]